ncbi:F0F1 ATP synthase subunit delta [Saccharothrix coeruleofusca]|uniref:ATP synthase subunit delta n=1 Tax=Saccharothrix coeruleofusca TaxID=33919 RepID=A0A918ALN8_9PSEU|nr:F0F1 ATP synthase subunit delta [Saccharothrix coeruleofusca]MBP2338770.1 F-type H+-transporting ATPase subunit delta [Saccharothrix coeruleofusca]GGP46080.1 ATP synthase subunit delta [Saccharothrix coeruleofusca]
MTLHAASRDALAAAELRLLELVEATASADALTALGEELFSVVDLLSAQPQLRRAFGDSSSDPAGRERLARTLLGGKVSDPTLTVLVSVVTAKWSSPRELVDGLESLARTALLVRAERDGRLDAVEDELFRLGRIIAGDTDLERVLTDPAGDTAGKLALLDSLISGKVEQVTRVLATQLVRTPRGLGVVPGLGRLAELAAKRRERSVAHVRSAVELSVEQQDRLVATLTRIYSRPIALHVEVDPSLAGGLLIKIGDEVIDGSVAGRLAALRRDLAG